MTAALASLSLSSQIEKYGAYAGLAAVVGLGVLALLYFAQAREVKRLREWAGRAPERDAELQQRAVADSAYFQHVLTDEPVIVDDVASLVLSQGHHSVDGLLRELEARGDLEVHGVGDCLAPRTVEEAVLEGLRVGTLV